MERRREDKLALAKTIATRAVFALVVTFALSYSPIAQSRPNSDGIQQYERGDFAKAVATLKGSDNFEDQYYLGLSNEKLGKQKDSRKAFETSFKNGFAIVEDTLTGPSENPSGSTSGQSTKKPLSARLSDLSHTIEATLASATRALGPKGNLARDNFWILRGKFIFELKSMFDRGETAYSKDELQSDVHILSKKKPSFPDGMRGGSDGSAILLVIFSADGKITAGAPIKSSSPGFVVEAYKAAETIVFTPATKDGKPVTTFRQVEYSFSSR